MVLKLKGSGVGGLKLRSAALDLANMTDLVAWYKADSLGLSNGSTVTSWPDDSTNNNDLNSYDGTPVYNASDALLGGMPSVTYNGDDGNYKSSPTGLPAGSSAHTVYVVGYWDGSSGTWVSFGWGSNTAGDARALVVLEPSGLTFNCGGATSQTSIAANSPFIFSHAYVAGQDFTNTTNNSHYVNGTKYSGTLVNGTPNLPASPAQISVGKHPDVPANVDYPWRGGLAEVLVFNTTHNEVTRGRIEKYLANKYGIPITPVKTAGRLISRTTASATPSIVTSGLVLYLDAGNPASYPGSGTTWTDLSGQGNNATLASHTFDSGNGGSIVFNGSQNAPTSTNGFPFGSSAGSIAGWAKISIMTGGTSWIFSYGSPFQSASRFVGRLGSTFWAGGYNDDITFGTAQTNTWFNMVATWDGSNARMYIDGSLVTGPTSRSWNTVSSAAYVGAQTSGGEGWYGNIAQVLVYNRALTDAEVLQNFNIDKARFGL